MHLTSPAWVHSDQTKAIPELIHIPKYVVTQLTKRHWRRRSSGYVNCTSSSISRPLVVPRSPQQHQCRPGKSSLRARALPSDSGEGIEIMTVILAFHNCVALCSLMISLFICCFLICNVCLPWLKIALGWERLICCGCIVWTGLTYCIGKDFQGGSFL
jgi:hypothetical protein